MSQAIPTILFLGSSEVGERLKVAIEPLGGYVYTPGALLDTLAMAVTYWPDRVILDAKARPELTEQVAIHLESIDLSPVIVHDEQTLFAALADLFPQLALPPERVM